MTHDKGTSRRTFLSGAAGVCAFDIIPGSVFAQPALSDRINFGHIGIGGPGSRFLRPESSGPTQPSMNPGANGRPLFRTTRRVPSMQFQTSRHK